MDTKLTLKLNKEIINFAKKQAKKRNTTPSKMVEKYFRNLALKDRDVNFNLPKNVQELSGVIAAEKLESNKKLKGY